MKEFERSEEYETKIFLDAFESHVVLDAKVKIVRQSGRKLKAYCPATNTFLQFPTNLRHFVDQEYIADVIKAKKSTGKVFYRAYRGSIRDIKTGEIVG